LRRPSRMPWPGPGPARPRLRCGTSAWPVTRVFGPSALCPPPVCWNHPEQSPSAGRRPLRFRNTAPFACLSLNGWDRRPRLLCTSSMRITVWPGQTRRHFYTVLFFIALPCHAGPRSSLIA